MEKILVVLEVSQKQSYIFKTDGLKQNVGASMIIRKVTEVIGQEYSETDDFFFAGGGKSVYEFADRKKAESFVRCVSERVLVCWPGCELYVGTHAYDDEKDCIIDAVDQLYGNLETRKSERKQSFRLYGLGIAKESPDSQMPVFKKKDEKEVSAEAYAKLTAAVDERDDTYKGLLPKGTVNGKPYEFPLEFEDIGVTKETKDYIGIIVVDGNRMGKKIQRFADKYKQDFKDVAPGPAMQNENKTYKVKFRELSDAIDDVYQKAVLKTNEYIAEHLNELRDKGIISVPAKGKEHFLPVRPLIAAGDDLCIVTEGRIAFMYAEKLLANIRDIGKKEFGESENLKEFNFQMHACAGLALIKSHYPFFRAHELAEELCSNAKKALAEPLPSDSNFGDTEVIDFHIVQGEIEGSLKQIRREKYDNSMLTARPYFLDQQYAKGKPTFEDMKGLMKYFKEEANTGRGLVKQYRDALKEGQEAMDQFFTLHQIDFARKDSKWKHHLVKARGTAFDAIEIMDIYNDLEK